MGISEPNGSKITRSKSACQEDIVPFGKKSCRSSNGTENRRKDCYTETSVLVKRVECTAFQSCDQPPSTGSSAPVVKVASNARKRTALAISSDVPKRFIGTIPVIFSLIWAASSLPVNTLSMIGVL